MFDTVGLLYASDVMPPATFGVVQTGWVPTLAITVCNRAIPAPGPLRLRFRVQAIHDGYADEICEAWDSEDRLVMQSTQMTALRIPADARPRSDARVADLRSSTVSVRSSRSMWRHPSR